MTNPVPLAYARHQLPIIVGMFGYGLRSAVPFLRPRENPTRFEPYEFEVAPMPDELVNRYLVWCGADPARYPGILPPHLVSRWGMTAFARLTGQTRFPLLGVLNQGARIEEVHPLPRGESFRVRAVTIAIDEEPNRYRIHNRVVAGTRAHPESIVVDSIAAVPRGGRPKSAAAASRVEPEFRTIARWDAPPRTGLDFALLTGDFNPIHWFSPIADRTGFRGTIMHGFGTLARAYEGIRNEGTTITAIDARFVRPLPFPHRGVDVQVAVDPASPRAFRVRGGDGTVYLAGTTA